MSTYKLYATKTGEIPDGVGFSLRPCNTNYLLVFTDKELKKPFVEIPPETELTEQERQFVARCKTIINQRYLDGHKEEYAEALNGFLDSLEREVLAEKKKAAPRGKKSAPKKNSKKN